jgi:elongation factor P--(R)-beta-lysine ligase
MPRSNEPEYQMLSQQSFRSTATIETLVTRAKLLRRLRNFFDELGFVEVQTPTLSRDTVIDRHIDPIEVPMGLNGGPARDGNPSANYFLQSSPEAAMKRLLACGMTSIYQVGPVFRSGERGARHNPEFTMAEWYRVGDDFDAGLQLTSDLLTCLLDTNTCDRVSFQQTFVDAVGIDCFTASVDDLSRRSLELGVIERLDWSDDWDDWVHLLFSMRVQPTLGLVAPVLVTHFPASQAALAQISGSDPRTAERFELFYRGLELANGYHELLDPKILRERSTVANQERQRDGKHTLPVESRLLEAMDYGIPKSTGCALGFDRVVMLATGAQRIEEVIPFPIEIA